MGKGKSRLKVAYAGRLIAEKGVRELMAGAEAALAAGASLHVRIAGSGPLQDEVAQAAATCEHLEFLGALSHPDMARLLLESDVFCFPTLYGEGMPTVLMEAAACGCALMTTDTGGTRELVPGQEYGVVLADAAPATIAHELADLAGEGHRLRALQQKAARHVRERFSWRATADAVRAAFIFAIVN